MEGINRRSSGLLLKLQQKDQKTPLSYIHFNVIGVDVYVLSTEEKALKLMATILENSQNRIITAKL